MSLLSVVVGSVLGVALIGAAFWFAFRRMPEARNDVGLADLGVDNAGPFTGGDLP